MPKLRDLSMRWVRELSPPALDTLDLACPEWRIVRIAAGKRMYFRLAAGVREIKEEEGAEG